MTRTLALVLTLASSACTDSLNVTVDRPSARWDVDVPEDPSARSAALGYATPPANLVTTPCGAGRLCGKVAWTRSCVVNRRWSLKREELRIEQPDVPLNATVLAVSTLGSMAGIALAAAVGNGLARASPSAHDAAAPRIAPSAVAGMVVGTTVGAVGIGVDVAAIVELRSPRRLVSDKVEDADRDMTDQEVGAPCGRADMSEVTLKVELPGGNVAIPVDRDGRFAIDLGARLRDEQSELPWFMDISIARGRFDGAVVGHFDVDAVMRGRRAEVVDDVSAQ